MGIRRFREHQGITGQNTHLSRVAVPDDDRDSASNCKHIKRNRCGSFQILLPGPNSEGIIARATADGLGENQSLA